MPEQAKSQFDAESVVRVVTVNPEGRVELELSDAEGSKHVVSLPLGAAIALARLLCDFSDTPFLRGRPRSAGANGK